MATLRGMRVELAIKEKACIRLNRDLDESKKTVKKLQKERDSYLKNEKPDKSGSAGSKKVYDPSHYTENFDQQAMKHAMDKIRMMEMDFKALYEKRVQDVSIHLYFILFSSNQFSFQLKILQTAHERELAACHETVRILQDRLKERDAVYAHEKRRNGPIDYYALKAKVNSHDVLKIFSSNFLKGASLITLGLINFHCINHIENSILLSQFHSLIDRLLVPYFHVLIIFLVFLTFSSTLAEKKI